VSTVSAELGAWLAARREQIDSALERLLTTMSAPEVLCEAMRYSVTAGGKRLRPMLVLASAEATAEAGGLSPESALPLAMPAACAVELIHTYSLVHDDLPAMDNDTLRRGRPTSHVVFSEGMAILSGDALLTEAFALLAREPAAAPSIDARELAVRKLAAIRAIGDAAGAAGMVGGQAVDLQAAVPGAPPLDADGLRAMHARKTGALITGSAQAGALMAGATTPQLDAVTSYARNIGLAFQIVDDILDVEGVSSQLGKTAGKDAAAGKPTYPSLYGLAESRRLASECVDRALASLTWGGLGGQLAAIARWVASRTH
jgi:geranylgeranyl pyrophosphate synthase